MNFLSHFYFERFTPHPERVVGNLLPDLLKNVDKEYVFHPNRFETQLFTQPGTTLLYEGWNRHVEIDKLFHSSDFFIEHSHQLRKLLDPILHDLPIRASFMAHIAVELILDHLLIKDGAAKVSRLYEHLEEMNISTLKKFLSIIGLEDSTRFFSFYNKFIEWKYIYEYENISQIAHPLFHISKRIWTFDITEEHKKAVSDILMTYTIQNLSDYKSIFQYIQDKITHLD